MRLPVRGVALGDLEALPRRPRRVAVGTFDGVHRGHAHTIRGCDTVVTFDPHPRALLASGPDPELLTPIDARVRLLRGLGVRDVIVLRFDAALANLSPAAFIDELLVDRLGAIHVSVGVNFRFGRGGEGTPELLAARREFTTASMPLLRLGGDVVSSSRIRAHVRAGAVEQAACLLGRPHAVTACAIGGGVSRRHRIRFIPGCVVPPPGVYRVAVQAGGGSEPQAATVEILSAPARETHGEAVLDHGRVRHMALGRPTLVRFLEFERLGMWLGRGDTQLRRGPGMPETAVVQSRQAS